MLIRSTRTRYLPSITIHHVRDALHASSPSKISRQNLNQKERLNIKDSNEKSERFHDCMKRRVHRISLRKKTRRHVIYGTLRFRVTLQKQPLYHDKKANENNIRAILYNLNLLKKMPYLYWIPLPTYLQTITALDTNFMNYPFLSGIFALICSFNSFYSWKHPCYI